MHTPPNTLFLSAVALLFVGAVFGQRSSPQFSFPPPGSMASQFGADVFAANNQDLSSLQQGGQPALVPLGASSASLGLSIQDQSPVSSQESSRQPPVSQPAASSQPQLARPALSITTLGNQQQQSQQQAQSQRQSQASAAAASGVSPVAATSSLREPQHHQSTRHHSQAGASSSQPHRSSGSQAAASSHHSSQSSVQASSSSSSASHNSNNNNHHHQHPPSVHAQIASQTNSAASLSEKQAAIDAARKAEATAASLAATSGQNYHCPDSFGFFRHHKSCDKYYACENGTATLKLCGNGLNFDDSDPKRENCAYPFSVDCGADRTDLEPPISTPHCPRLYGLFADTANCRVFYSCWNGEASKYECPPGLAYDNDQRVCVWADLVDRCDQSEVSDGFVCPDPTEADQPGHYTRHAHPTDCRKFYVCIEGVARPYGCSFGTVFNVDSLQCDEPDNVSGCEKYYGDMDPKLAKKLAREGTQQGGASSSGNNGPQNKREN